MSPSGPRSQWGGGAGGDSSTRGLETQPCPRPVPVKGYARERQGSRGSYLRARGRGRVPGSSPTQSSWDREVERVSNQAQGLPDHRPRTAERAQRRNAVRAGVGSRPVRPRGRQLDVGPNRSKPSCRHKLLEVERGAPGEHVVGYPAEFVREDRQGFPLAMFPLEALE